MFDYYIKQSNNVYLAFSPINHLTYVGLSNDWLIYILHLHVIISFTQDKGDICSHKNNIVIFIVRM